MTAETTGFHISKEDLDSLMDEYTDFNAKKSQLVDIVRNSTKQTIEKIEELQFFALKRVLTRNGLLQSDDEFKCRFCNSFTGKNRASLGAHVRGCKFNPAKTANA